MTVESMTYHQILTICEEVEISSPVDMAIYIWIHFTLEYAQLTPGGQDERMGGTF